MFSAAKLIKVLKRIIGQQPIVVERWVLTSGDGVSIANAWSFYYSWEGRMDSVARGTWNTLMSNAGQTTTAVFVLTVPAVTGQDAPMSEDKIVLHYPTGVSLGTYRVITKQDFSDSEGVLWKHELTVETLQ